MTASSIALANTAAQVEAQMKQRLEQLQAQSEGPVWDRVVAVVSSILVELAEVMKKTPNRGIVVFIFQLHLIAYLCKFRGETRGSHRCADEIELACISCSANGYRACILLGSFSISFARCECSL